MFLFPLIVISVLKDREIFRWSQLFYNRGSTSSLCSFKYQHYLLPIPLDLTSIKCMFSYFAWILSMPCLIWHYRYRHPCPPIINIYLWLYVELRIRVFLVFHVYHKLNWNHLGYVLEHLQQQTWWIRWHGGRICRSDTEVLDRPGDIV